MTKDLLLAASAWFPKPVRHYTFEPNTVNGNVLTDLSGVQNGAIVGSPVFAAGQRGNCVKFDGNSANYINIGNTNFVQQTGIFSIAFWAKTQYADSGIVMVLAGNTSASAQPGWGVLFDDRTVSGNRGLRFFLSRGTSNLMIAAINEYDILPTDGLYHHYAFTSDNTRLYAYIDGDQVVSSAYLTTVNPSATAVRSTSISGIIGTAGTAYNGEIDEFRIIPKTLTPQQVKRLYQQGQ